MNLNLRTIRLALLNPINKKEDVKMNLNSKFKITNHIINNEEKDKEQMLKTYSDTFDSMCSQENIMPFYSIKLIVNKERTKVNNNTH